MIDSATQTKVFEILADYLGEQLGTTARKTILAAAPGPHEPTEKLHLGYTGDYGWAFADSLPYTKLADELGKIGLHVAQDDGAIDAVVITEVPAKQYVYVLTAELEDTNETGDYDGITTVHATQEGALARFLQWLDSNGLDWGAARYGEVKTDTFLGNDPDPDTFEGGETIHWGINKMEVRA